MAAERAVIQHVKNNVVTVSLPYLEDTNQTFLISAVAAAGTTLAVKDTAGFANDDYIVLGEPGTEQAEIVKIGAAVSAGTSLTVGAVVFPHPAGTKVTLIRYNQVALYGHATSDSAAPTAIGAAVGLDVSKGNNEMVATTTYTYYYARYYNSTSTVYSAYSDSVAATGLSARARGEIKKEFLSIYNEEIDDLVTDDWLNRSINRWQRVLSKRRKRWSVLKESTISDLVEDTQGYSLPSDIQDYSVDSIISIKIEDGSELNNIDQRILLALTSDHIGTVVGTAASLGATSLTLSDSSDFAQQDSSVYCKGVKVDYTLNTESTGVLSGITTATAITAFADAGSGYTTVTAAGHGYSNGDTAYIGSTRNYDGSYTVSGVAGNNFNILKTFVADDATGATSTDDGSITEALSANDEVWQTYTKGIPIYYMIDPNSGKIKLYPIPDSTLDNKNIYIEYWQKFVDLSDDADETLFRYPENCYLYMYWQLAIRRRLGAKEEIARESRWRSDLEEIVAEDPDYRDVRITPNDLYSNPY